jgi:hypothetical protein
MPRLAPNMAVPGHIPIFYEPDSPTGRIGIHGSGDKQGQFFGCVVAALPVPAPKQWEEHKRWYAVLHRFDLDGRHLGTDHEFCGTTASGESAAIARAEAKLGELMSRLENPQLRDIEIDLFSVTIDGHVFGLIDASDPEEEYEAIHLVPNDLAFFEPWEGDYDT